MRNTGARHTKRNDGRALEASMLTDMATYVPWSCDHPSKHEENSPCGKFPPALAGCPNHLAGRRRASRGLVADRDQGYGLDAVQGRNGPTRIQPQNVHKWTPQHPPNCGARIQRKGSARLRSEKLGTGRRSLQRGGLHTVCLRGDFQNRCKTALPPATTLCSPPKLRPPPSTPTLSTE